MAIQRPLCTAGTLSARTFLIINRFTFLGQLNLRQFSSPSMLRFRSKKCALFNVKRWSEIDDFFKNIDQNIPKSHTFMKFAKLFNRLRHRLASANSNLEFRVWCNLETSLEWIKLICFWQNFTKFWKIHTYSWNLPNHSTDWKLLWNGQRPFLLDTILPVFENATDLQKWRKTIGSSKFAMNSLRICPFW